MSEDEMRVCKACGLPKPLAMAFYRNSATGCYRHKCRECERRDAHKKKIRGSNIQLGPLPRSEAKALKEIERRKGLIRDPQTFGEGLNR